MPQQRKPQACHMQYPMSGSSVSHRANRVLQQALPSTASSSTRGRVTIRTISPDRIAHMYRRLYLKAEMILRFMWKRNLIVELMGEEAVNPAEEEELFENIHVDPENPDKKTNQSWRVLPFQEQQWVVGKKMPSGQGTQDRKKNTHDPAVCQHPSDKMFGNGFLYRPTTRRATNRQGRT